MTIETRLLADRTSPTPSEAEAAPVAARRIGPRFPATDPPAISRRSRPEPERHRPTQLASLAPWLAATGIGCALVLCLAFRSRPASGPGLAAITLTLGYLATIVLGRHARADRTSVWERPAVGIVYAAIALVWVALLAMLSSGADASQMRLIAFASAALLAQAISFAVALPLALALGVIATIALLEAVQTGADRGAYAGLIAIGAAAAMLATCRLDRMLVENGRLRLRVHRQDRTIASLQAEFESLEGDWLWEFDRDNGLRSLVLRNGAQPGVEFDLIRTLDWARWLTDGCLRTEPARHDFQLLARAIETDGGFRELVLPVELAGAERWFSLSGRPICDSLGRVRFYRGVASDVTAARDDAVRTRHLARHDWLTGLANRAVFTHAIEAELERDDRPFHLLVIDLDGFKLINHQHGHEAGDRLLRAVARRLARSVRTGDLVARLQGDQFAVLVPDRSEEFAETCAERLRTRMRDPFSIEMLQLVIGASIGIATAPRDGDTAAALMKAADLALTHAKAAGRGGASRFNAAMETEARERRAMQLDLRIAIARQEFGVAFQPIVELATGRTVSAEALMRWSSPQRGSVSPGVFIALAEEAGLIGTLGTWVLERSCREARHLPDAVKVAVNVSPLQFRDPAFAEIVLAGIRRAGVAPARIEIEVTESVMMDATDTTRATLDTLRAAGVEVALDDFGTGFASLSYLTRFPFDRVKIDRSFVGDLAPGGGSLSIVRAIIELAHGLGMGTVAEGVETEAQLAILRELGCTHAQGYLFAHPMEPASLGARLADASG